MKRLLSHACAVTFFGALAIIPSACADNDQSIFVRSVLAPPQNRQNGGCTYTADPTAATISEGTLDIALRRQYDPMLLAASQMIQRGDPNNTRAESNRVHINGATVRVTDANGGEIAEFSTLGSGNLEPQLNNTPGFGVVSITAIDQPTAAKIAPLIGRPVFDYKQVVANIKLFGKTLGGVDLESGEFQFPIKVCNGCLVSFAGADDPAVKGTDCSLNVVTDNNQGFACVYGQDEKISCITCKEDPDPNVAAICNGQF